MTPRHQFIAAVDRILDARIASNDEDSARLIKNFLGWFEELEQDILTKPLHNKMGEPLDYDACHIFMDKLNEAAFKKRFEFEVPVEWEYHGNSDYIDFLAEARKLGITVDELVEIKDAAGEDVPVSFHIFMHIKQSMLKSNLLKYAATRSSSQLKEDIEWFITIIPILQNNLFYGGLLEKIPQLRLS